MHRSGLLSIITPATSIQMYGSPDVAFQTSTDAKKEAPSAIAVAIMAVATPAIEVIQAAEQSRTVAGS